MKRNTPVAAFVEQRPGFPGYVAGLIKGREKEALLERQFSGFEIGRKLYIVLSGRDWVSPHLMRIAGKFGAEIVSERALADVLALGGHKSVIVLSRQNDLLSVGMLDRMAEKLDSEQIRHLYFKPVFGIPFDIAEIHVVRTEFLKSTGLRGLRKAKGVFYQLGLEDKRWLFGEVAGRVSPYPRIVAIEPTSLCNLKCTMCPVHSSGGKENKRAAGMMKFGLYKRIINQLPEKEKVNLVLHGYGEPLLHPEIAEMVAYAKKAGIA
ncbi:MAG: radical SAM protein, partial [Candidatus Firestonebacteria bacterium]